MYYLYYKDPNSYDSKKLIGEFEDAGDAYDVVDKELETNENLKYVIEQTTGSFDSYGELLRVVVEEK